MPVEWLTTAFEGTDATPTDKPGQLTATLFKNGGQFLVQGKIHVQLTLPCARTLDPVTYELQPELFLALTQIQPARPGSRRPAPTPTLREEATDAALTDEDAAFDTFEGDRIVLDAFVREQILLDLPMFPLRSDLRSAAPTVIHSPPESAAKVAEIDPRLKPLQALAEKLKTEKK
ncbi:MAG: hypothetical protein RJA70_3265 [Pseudomonadota bacterium]